MSMVITNAYRFPNLSLTDMFLWVDKLKKEAEKKADDLSFKSIVLIATDFIDKSVLENAGLFLNKKEDSILNKSALRSAWSFLDNRLINSQKQNRFDPLNMSLSLFVVLDRQKNPIVVIRSQNREMKHFMDNFLKTQGDMFDYWDNTDKPDEVSESEWIRRGKVWNNIFKNNYNFENVGWKVSLVSEIGILKNPTPKKAYMLQPSFDDRLKRMTEICSIYKIQTDLGKDPKNKKLEDVDLYHLAYQAYKRGEWEGQEILKEKIEESLWSKIPQEA